MIDIGIYGGTFAPPHIGHINAALAFDDFIKPRKLYVIPTAIPPHKRIDDGDDPSMRLEMAELAFGGLRESIEVCDYEIRQSGRSYTALTLGHFAGLYPPSEYRLTFLCGTDMFLTLGSWYKPESIFALARIAFVRRERRESAIDDEIVERTKFYREGYAADIIEIEGETVEAASTYIRADIASGGDGMGLITDPVLTFIREKGLYGTNNG